ncbi:MAG: protoglobin domain-containing protein [Woeseiaceae bacterium]|jgi:hypothetical protein
MPNTEMMLDRLRFQEIDQDVIENLREAKQLLEPELDNMLDEFYEQILEEPLIRSVFSDEESIRRARDAQKKHWLETLLGGRLDSSYFKKAERIGRAHARVGLTPDWYIGGYSKMLVRFIQHISTVTDRDTTAIIESLCKAVLLDLDLVIHCYLEAKDKQIREILARATSFGSDMEQLNVELAQKVEQITERTSQLKTEDRLYVHAESHRTGAFARLKALFRGE